ncbi:MAG: head maturation protease, ClpP-related [Shewanella algae]
MPIHKKPDLRGSASVRFDVSPVAFERWNPGIHAASEDQDNTIGIYDVIGESFWSEGVTLKRIQGALRRIGSENPVIVNINSPGGDLFEGNAIYNALRQHKGEVTVNVLSLAASAASIIAMAASPGKLQIARSGFLMIHNAWTLAIGNRHDLRDIADFMEPLDETMADVYSLRTGETVEDMQKLMDSETWIGGKSAIEQGFADNYIEADQIEEVTGEQAYAKAAKKIDIALAKAGMGRTDRRKLLAEYKAGMHNAASDDTPRAIEYGTHNAAEFNLEPLPKISFP